MKIFSVDLEILQGTMKTTPAAIIQSKFKIAVTFYADTKEDAAEKARQWIAFNLANVKFKISKITELPF